MKSYLITYLGILLSTQSFGLAKTKYECMLHSQSYWVEDNSTLTSKASFQLVVGRAQDSQNDISVAIKKFNATITNSNDASVQSKMLYNKSMRKSIESIQTKIKRAKNGSIEKVALEFNGKVYSYRNFAIYNLPYKQQLEIPVPVRNLSQILDYIVWSLPPKPKIGQMISLPYHRQKHGEFNSNRLAARYYGMAVKVGDYSDIQYLAASSSNVGGTRVLRAKLRLQKSKQNFIIPLQKWETWSTIPTSGAPNKERKFRANSSHSIFMMHSADKEINLD